jgi:hypothetical protein
VSTQSRLSAVPAVSPVLTILEAAAHAKTTIWCIRTLIWEDRVRHCKLGKLLLVDRADLDRFLASEMSIPETAGGAQ